MFRAGSTGWFDTKTSTMFAWHVQNDVKRGGPPPKQVSISYHDWNLAKRDGFASERDLNNEFKNYRMQKWQ